MKTFAIYYNLLVVLVPYSNMTEASHDMNCGDESHEDIVKPLYVLFFVMSFNSLQVCLYAFSKIANEFSSRGNDSEQSRHHRRCVDVGGIG